jgi:hypothetical protein
LWVVEMVVGRGAAPSSDGTRRAPRPPPDRQAKPPTAVGSAEPGTPTTPAVGLRLPPNEGTTPLRRTHGGPEIANR